MKAQLAVVAAGVVLLTGCDSDNDQEGAPTTTSGTSPQGTGSKPFVGSYEGEDAPGYALTLTADGKYTTRNDTGETDRGRYRRGRAEVLVFTKSSACEAGGFGGTGRYRYSIEDDRLILELARAETGGCTGRTGSLTIPRSWVRKDR